jgi:CHAT domain-containing protein
VDRGTTILHLAAHSLVSQSLPLESAIALTVPPSAAAEPSENGLLQAWEVLEQVRLDADLVTLSGCQTALGKEASGEGIIGLTRAFQYAGARTVLASLWSVADDSTAELMDRLYRRLRSGTATNDALRGAQLDLLATPLALTGDDGESRELDASHPFHWAAFQVIGDWR